MSSEPAKFQVDVSCGFFVFRGQTDRQTEAFCIYRFLGQRDYVLFSSCNVRTFCALDAAPFFFHSEVIYRDVVFRKQR